MVALLAVAACQMDGGQHAAADTWRGGTLFWYGDNGCVSDLRPPSMVSVAYQDVDTGTKTLTFNIATASATSFSLYDPSGAALALNAASADLKFTFVTADGVKCNAAAYPTLGTLTSTLAPYVAPHALPISDKSESIAFSLYGVTTHFTIVATP